MFLPITSQDFVKAIYSTRLKKLLAISGVIISVLIIVVIVLAVTGENKDQQVTTSQNVCMSKSCIKTGWISNANF